MPMLVATRTVRIGRKEYAAGEPFEVATDKEARVWVKILRKARFSDAGAPAAVNLPKEVMSCAPIAPEPEVEPIVDLAEAKAEEPVEEPAPKRQYRRRDMSADQD